MSIELIRSEFQKSLTEQTLSAIEDKLSVIEKRFSAIEETLYTTTKKMKSIDNSVNIHLNVDDAALHLGISKSKMVELFDKKEITHTIINGNYYVKISDIDIWITTGNTKLSNWDADVANEQQELNSLKMGFSKTRYNYGS